VFEEGRFFVSVWNWRKDIHEIDEPYTTFIGCCQPTLQFFSNNPTHPTTVVGNIFEGVDK
jgi:hypothetical protein